MNNMENIIELKDVCFEYYEEDQNKTAILEHFSLNIQKGSFTAVLGHNGSGKSTLAKLLNGLNKPVSGQVLVEGMDTADEKKEMDIRRKVGMVFQNPDNQLVATIVEEDVAFGPENLGLAPDEIRRRVDEALKAVRMYEYREHAPHKLSGGQKQRVAIAGIIAMEPDCIVLDEPTAMLDPDGRKEVLEAVHELNRSKGVTVILITHYMEEVVDADYVFVMDQGKVVMEGEPREIFSHVQELKSHRLDVPQITLLAHELKEAGMDLPDGILTRKELIAAIKEAVGKKHVGAQAE